MSTGATTPADGLAGLPTTAFGLGGLGLGFDSSGGLLAGIPAAKYVPVTPLGALSAMNGDLMIPIVVVGVAIFLVIAVFLAVKAAITWKFGLLKDLKSDIFEDKLGLGDKLGGLGKIDSVAKFLREVAGDPPVQSQDTVNHLASIVMSSLESERCLDRILCSIGSYDQGASWTSYFSMIEPLVAETYKSKMHIMEDCAKAKLKAEDFPCGTSNATASATNATAPAINATAPAAGQQAKPTRLPLFATLGNNASLKPQANNTKNATAATPTSATPTPATGHGNVKENEV